MKRALYLLPLLLALLCSENVEAKKVKYPNGDYYVGKWKKKTPHGLGIMTYANGNVYTGLWVYGVKNGEGRMTYNDGSIYEGTWEANKYHGYGTMNYKDDSIYEGEWRYGLKQGTGKLVSCTGGDCNIYEGEWSKDSFHGQGKYTTSEGAVYEGSFYYGKKQGKGKEQTPQGWYEGEWKQGVFYAGRCSYTLSCGEKFTGTYENGRRKNGELTLSNGDWYEGDFLNSGKFYNGSCSYTEDNGDKYEGTYIKGAYGKGRLDLANGEWYHGTWKDGKFFQGDCLQMDERHIYQGSYENGRPYTGTFDGYWDENFYKGEFSRGVFVNGECELNGALYKFKGKKSDGVYTGRIVYNNGYFYEGILNSDMQKNGDGILSSEDTKEILNATFEENYVVKGNGSFVKGTEEYTFSIENKNEGNDISNVNIYNKGNLYLTEKEKRIDSDSIFYYINVLIDQKVEKDRIEKEMAESREFCKKHFMGHVYKADKVSWNSSDESMWLLGTIFDIKVTLQFISADKAEYTIHMKPTDALDDNPFIGMQFEALCNELDGLTETIEYMYIDGMLFLDGEECKTGNNFKNIQYDMGLWNCWLKQIK